MLTLTGKPGSPQSLWGFVSLAHVPLISSPEPEPEEPDIVETGEGETIYSRFLQRKIGEERRRKQREEEEILAVMLTLMS